MAVKRSLVFGIFRLSVLLLAAMFMLSACGDPAPGEGVEHPPKKGPDPEVVSPSQAVHSADVAKTVLDPMDEAEIRKLLSGDTKCTFSYTAEGKPVFAAGVSGEGASGVAKIHGKLVALKSTGVRGLDSLRQGGSFRAKGMAIDVTEVKGKSDAVIGGKGTEANMHFELIEENHSVEYRGWYRCRASERGNK